MKAVKQMILLAAAALMGISCSERSVKSDFPYDVPQAYLEEAEDIPPFWLATTDEVNDFIKKTVRKGSYEQVGTSAGGRPIYAVTYGVPRQGKGSTTYSGASVINKPETYRGPDNDKKVYMAISGVHGFELEGIVGSINLISVLETGRDLNGTQWSEITELARQLDRIVLIPLVNPDGRDRVPIRMESFKGSAPAAFMAHEYLNTGGRDGGKLLGWPDCKEYIPLDFSSVEFPGSYPNDAGVNIMHDDFFGHPQPETRMLYEITEREKPDLMLNMHTGRPRNNYFIGMLPPCESSCDPILMRVWEDLYRSVHTELTLYGLQKTNNVELESTPPRRQEGIGNFNLNSAIGLHCGALVVTVEDGSHGYTGVYDDGTPVEHTPLKSLKSELLVHQESMKFLLTTGGLGQWSKDYFVE